MVCSPEIRNQLHINSDLRFTIIEGSFSLIKIILMNNWHNSTPNVGVQVYFNKKNYIQLHVQGVIK